MGSSEGNERPWVPYMNTKDCSQGFCSYYCPHWCYLFPPPPPFDNSPGPNFSPLVIAIIGILASAFLLLSYYAIISKYCKNRESSSRIENYPVLESEENHQEPGNHEPWHVPTNGLDESLIKSITMFKYKKGDGSIEGTYCSVCLSEFQEDESLRLLPKCNHAFHSMCIDTWLKSHSNCPLCRANIILISSLPPVSESHPPPPLPLPIPNESRFQNSPDNENVAFEEDIETGIRERDSETSETRGGEGEQIRRRSVSMDDSFPGSLSIADILQINDEDGDQNEEHRFPEDVGESKRAGEEMSRSNNRSRILLCVTSPTAMKRSFSSGRFLSSKRARGRNIVLPL